MINIYVLLYHLKNNSFMMTYLLTHGDVINKCIILSHDINDKIFICCRINRIKK